MFNISKTRWYPLVSERRAARIRCKESCRHHLPLLTYTLLFISAGTTHILHSPRLANTSSCINENQTQRRGGRKYRDEQHQLSRHPSRSSCRFNTQQTGNEKFDFWGLFRHGKALMFQLLLRTNHLRSGPIFVHLRANGVLIDRFRFPKNGFKND